MVVVNLFAKIKIIVLDHRFWTGALVPAMIAILGWWWVDTGQKNDVKYKEAAIMPHLVTMFKYEDLTYSILNDGNGSAHIGRVQLNMSDACVTSDQKKKWQYMTSVYKRGAEMQLKKAFSFFLFPGDKGKKFEIVVLDQPQPRDIVPKDGKINIFQIVPTGVVDFNTDELERVFDNLHSWYMLKASYCSDTGSYCGFLNDLSINEDCSFMHLD